MVGACSGPMGALVLAVHNSADSDGASVWVCMWPVLRLGGL